jgi:hypothetical protein
VAPDRHLAHLVACGLLLATLLPPTVAFAEPPVRDNYAVARTRLLAAPLYRTQLDDSRYASSNCGPAVLGMVLDAYGISLDNLTLRRLTHSYQGNWPGRGGTALQHIARVAEDFGLRASGLYEEDGETFRHWTSDDVLDEVRRGRWVIPLVRYNLLPGHEGGVGFGHYILVYAMQGDGYLYHDPAYRPIEQGRARWISRAQLDRAMVPVLEPRQAVALGHEALDVQSVSEWVGVMQARLAESGPDDETRSAT